MSFSIRNVSPGAIVQNTPFPFFSILFLIFLTLKLTGVIHWSWWLVSLPLWGPLAVVGAIWLLALVSVAALAWITRRKNTK